MGQSSFYYPQALSLRPQTLFGFVLGQLANQHISRFTQGYFYISLTTKKSAIGLYCSVLVYRLCI